MHCESRAGLLQWCVRKRRRSRRFRPAPLVGSEAFGAAQESDGGSDPVGAAAVGGGSAALPLRGAVLFGNDPQGNARGSEAIGASDEETPLRGALLFGNDPKGEARGSEAFGAADAARPLRGALLFGNDPEGEARGSEVFGAATAALQLRGAAAFGGGEQLRERLGKDDLGYDFGGVMLKPDDSSIAGVRRHPQDRHRLRVVHVLHRCLDFDVDLLRHGLNEDSIKWGRLKHDFERLLDHELAEELRRWYRQAPGNVLGIAQVRELLEEHCRMHTFTLTCAWERRPFTLSIYWDGDIHATAEMLYHKELAYFCFKDLDGQVLGYADVLEVRDGEQTARIRDIDGRSVGAFVLHALAGDGAKGRTPRFRATVVDAHGRELCEMREQVASERRFKAVFRHPDNGDEIGRVSDTLHDGEVKSELEFDVSVPHVFAWALAAIVADLSRLRRGGWPGTVAKTQPSDAAEEADDELPSIVDELGPSRFSSSSSS